MTDKKQPAEQKASFWRFLISKVFWLNAGIAILVFVLFIWLTLYFIQQYSRQGESKTVPNLIGMTIDEAKENLDGANLKYTIADSAYDPDARPLEVLNQEPAPDEKVKTGRRIYLTINMLQPPMTEIPAIDIGTSAVSVREMLAAHGLKIGNVIYKPFEFKDVYLDIKYQGKSLQTGVKIPKGSAVDLILGNGLGNTEVELPDFSGLSYIEAVNLIQLKDLSLGTIIASGTITDTVNAFVVKQEPIWSEGKMVNLGTMVDLWISQDAPAPDMNTGGGQ